MRFTKSLNGNKNINYDSTAGLVIEPKIIRVLYPLFLVTLVLVVLISIELKYPTITEITFFRILRTITEA